MASVIRSSTLWRACWISCQSVSILLAKMNYRWGYVFVTAEVLCWEDVLALSVCKCEGKGLNANVTATALLVG